MQTCIYTHIAYCTTQMLSFAPPILGSPVSSGLTDTLTHTQHIGKLGICQLLISIWWMGSPPFKPIPSEQYARFSLLNSSPSFSTPTPTCASPLATPSALRQPLTMQARQGHVEGTPFMSLCYSSSLTAAHCASDMLGSQVQYRDEDWAIGLHKLLISKRLTISHTYIHPYT